MNPPYAHHLVTAAALSLLMLAMTSALHHHALHSLAEATGGKRLSRLGVVAFLVALVAVHLLQIGLYAGAYALGAQLLSLGRLGGPSGNALDYFYFAAETYSTLGYGDIVPVGALRLIASVESLNGLLLLAWSGSFLFGVMDLHGLRPLR